MVEIDNLTSKAKKMEHANRLFSDAMWKIRSRISSVQNVLTLFTDYQNEGIDEELLMLLKKTRREMWEMMRHAENLRFLSVVDLGAVSLEPHLHSYHIREMVDSVVVACGILISAEEGVVTVNVDIDRELAVITDRQIMGKVISVLLFNAIEYNEGEITVTVKAEVREDGTVLTVTDNGWGIPDEEQEKIFTYAFRGSAAKKVPGSGAGVELYLARKLLMKIGGDLQFISKENHGSTFTITLREPENAEE